MKKCLVILATFCLFCTALFALSACGVNETIPPQRDEISFKTFDVDGTNAYGSVSYDTDTFRFADEIKLSGNAKFTVTLDIEGIQTVPTKTVSLDVGDNVFYVIETVDGDVTALYTVVIHRNALYEVSFDAPGNGEIVTQYVEEGDCAIKPEMDVFVPLGYDFTWDFDFSKPITSNVTINGQIAEKNEMKNFEFTSSATTCEITGLKDDSVTSIVIPDYVTSIGNDAFFNCTDLESVTIGNGVKSIGDFEFWGCTGLTSVTIGNGVTSIGNDAFYFCTSLTSITIPDSVKSIGDSAFEYCAGLKSVTIPDSVTSIGNYAFSSCTGLTSINVADGNTAYKSIDGNLYTKDGKIIVQYAIGKTDTSFVIPDSVTSIGETAFVNCTGLKSVTIGNGVKSIGVFAFWGCTGLTSITIPDSVTSIGNYAFSGCASLTSVTIGNGVTSIGDSAFRYCTGLMSITIPDSVKSIGDSAFSYCTGLKSVTIGNGVTSIGDYAFEECTGLTSVTIGNGVTSIGNSAFEYCTSLTSIKYRGTETQWNAISEGSDWNLSTGSYTITYNYSGK